jgi:hypothetical protein
MKSLKPSSLALLSLAVSLAAVQAAPAQTKLRWKFTEGSKSKYSMTQNIDIAVDAGGQKIDTKMTQEIDTTWAVEKVASNGSAVMKQSIDRMQLTVKGPTGEMKFDSKDPDAASPELAQMKPLMAAMIGQPFELTMSPLGEISDVKVPAKMIEAGKDAGPAGAFLSEKGLKDMATQGSLTFPEKELKSGDEWNSTKALDMPGLGKLNMKAAYKYRGPAEKLEKSTADISLEIVESPLGLKVKEQKASATYLFDNDKGMLRSSEVNQEMTLTGEIMGNAFSQVITTKTAMKLVDGSKKD